MTFGLAWPTCVDAAKSALPRQWLTSSQLLNNTLVHSLGRAAGAGLGGLYMARHGGKALYTIASIGSAGLFAVHLLGWAVLRASGRPGPLDGL